MHFVSVRLYEGEQRMEVFVRVDGKLLIIPVRWFQRNPSDAPPKDWVRTVKKEVELFKAKGANKSLTSLKDFITGGLK